MFSIRLQESLLGEVNRVRVVDNQWSNGVIVARGPNQSWFEAKIMNVESPPIDAIIPFGRSGLINIKRAQPGRARHELVVE